MYELITLNQQVNVPRLIASSEQAQYCYFDFFVSSIRNQKTRRVYSHIINEFLKWCDGVGVSELTSIRSLHVAAWIEEKNKNLSAPTAKLHLAALRSFFNWLVVGHILPYSPAASVRGPRYSIAVGKTPVLEADEARILLDFIETTKIIGLRDRALIGLMVYSFARIGAAITMKVDDVFTQNRRLWIRLHEKGGKIHQMPCHHNLEEYLDSYIAAADISADLSSPLFRSASSNGKSLTSLPFTQQDAHSMIRRRAKVAGIATKINNHSFRATGITAYLKNGGNLELAAKLANHSSPRTTKLYDRRSDNITLDEIERIRI